MTVRSVRPISEDAAGDRLEALWNAHYAEVFAYALRRLGDQEAARDAAAETFLVAWRRLDVIPERSRAWLFGVAIKVIANSRRGRRRGEALIARLERAHDPATAAASAEDALAGAVAAAFNRLSETDRDLLSLVVWEELKPREAASALGIPTTRFSVRLHRAKQRLRNELASGGHVGSDRGGSPAVGAPPSDSAMEPR